MANRSAKYGLVTLFVLLLIPCVSPDAASTGMTAPPSDNTNLKSDESVILFPTNARYDQQRQQWVVPVHGWVFEAETDSIWRTELIRSLEQFVDIQADTSEDMRFKARTRMFLVDNERDKNIVLAISGQQYNAPTSDANGHFQFDVYLTAKADSCNNWLLIKVITRADDTRNFNGKTQCLDAHGISVISDIDDTIKDSNVLDKKQLMKNTFTKQFRAVNGMARLYRAWQQQGYRFHYVSASPWQLYPFLEQFLQDNQFPAGSMHLKLVRLKDSSFFNLFDSPEEGKLPTITKLFKDYPKRQFILVGDSGEKDPEIYAQITRQYPDKIIKIFIHDIRKDRKRLANIFSGIAKSKWYVFDDASEILSTPGLLTLQNQ